jgi:hypothetical protein
MTTLLHPFKDLVSNDLFVKLASRCDEQENQLKKAFEVCICTLLVGIKNCKDLEVLLKAVDEIEVSFEKQLDDFYTHENLFSEAFVYLNRLFPNKKERLSEMISNEMCIKSESARVLFNVVTLLVLANLKKEVPENLFSLLDKEAQTLYGILPRGVRLILGIPNAEKGYDYFESSRPEMAAFSFFRFKKGK